MRWLFICVVEEIQQATQWKIMYCCQYVLSRDMQLFWYSYSDSSFKKDATIITSKDHHAFMLTILIGYIEHFADFSELNNKS